MAEGTSRGQDHQPRPGWRIRRRRVVGSAASEASRGSLSLGAESHQGGARGVGASTPSSADAVAATGGRHSNSGGDRNRIGEGVFAAARPAAELSAKRNPAATAAAESGVV